MRLTGFSIFLCIMSASLLYGRNVNAQELLKRQITLKAQALDAEKVLKKIENMTGIRFVYANNLFKQKTIISHNWEDQKVETILLNVLQPLNIQYNTGNEPYVVLKKKVAMLPSPVQQEMYVSDKLTVVTAANADSLFLLKGKITNKSGTPLANVTVMINGTSKATQTKEDGTYIIKDLLQGTHEIIVSCVGYISVSNKVTIHEDVINIDFRLNEDVINLQQVVVTGTGNPKKKIESSVAISTVNSRQMEMQAPLNSADLLKFVPGLTVESSGGDGPGSIRVRGLPGGGYRYVGIMEDGLQVVPTGYSGSPSADQYFKADLTIRTVEAIRGGTSAILMPNTPGAVINNISYTGAAKQYGKFKFTTGLSQGLYRWDANTGGSMGKNWRYNIGGFYRVDDGIKEPAFKKANEGGQLKVNITRNFKDNKGYIRFYGKYLNDNVQWLVPGYYGFNKNYVSEGVPGFDNFKETLLPSETKFSFVLPGGKTTSFDLKNGYHTQLGYGGMLLNFATKNNWTFRNNFRYQHTDIERNFHIVTEPRAYQSNVNYYYSNGEQLSNPTGFYTIQQITSSRRTDVQIVNNFDVSKKFNRNSVSLGASAYIYDLKNSENFNFTTNTEIRKNPRIILVGSPTKPALTPGILTSRSGYTRFGGKTGTYSVYANDEWEVNDNWRIDVGARIDKVHINGQRGKYSGSSTSSGGSGYVIDGEVPFQSDLTYWSATLGLNYKINEAFATFLRASRTYNAFNIDDFSAADISPADLKKRNIYLAEIGAKYQKNKFSLFSSLTYSSVSNFPLVIGIPGANGSVINQSTFGSSRTFGWETEAAYQLTKALGLRLTATVQDAKFTEYNILVSPDARPDLAGKPYSWAGNQPERLPVVNLQMAASYDYKKFNLFANAIYIGNRWSTNANTYKLNGYVEFNSGAGYTFGKHIEVRGWVNNILNSRGLTEGNVRGEQFIDVSTLQPGQLMLGRAILPRSFWMSVSYSF